MSSTGHKVTIVGGTGTLGKVVSRIFLTEYKPAFPVVRVAVRNTTSDIAKELEALGAELIAVDEVNPDASLRRAFDGVDVAINLLQPNDGNVHANALAVQSKVSVLFLSEFGIDWRVNPWPGYEVNPWAAKRVVAAKAKEAAQGTHTKLIAVNTGGFLELTLGPFLGFDFAKNTYSIAGSPSQRLTFTSPPEIARTVARLATLALNPSTAGTVPEIAWVAGSTVSVEEVRDAVARLKGVDKGDIVSEDLDALVKRTREAFQKDPAGATKNLQPWFRIASGNGSFDLSKGAVNELVNPGETLWKWKTVDDALHEKLGV